MKNLIKEFKHATIGLKACSINLDAVVEPALKKLIEDKDLEGMNELVDSLPTGYQGCQRIYYAMLNIPSKGDWSFERHSGYAGYKCQKCDTWIHTYQKLICDCDK